VLGHDCRTDVIGHGELTAKALDQKRSQGKAVQRWHVVGPPLYPLRSLDVVWYHDANTLGSGLQRRSRGFESDDRRRYLIHYLGS
jgi:hypothetical protein